MSLIQQHQIESKYQQHCQANMMFQPHFVLQMQQQLSALAQYRLASLAE
jgi:hypothetical protein